MTRVHQWRSARLQEAFEQGFGKASELAEQAGYKGAGAKGGWNGGKAPVGAYRGTSTEAEVKKERIVLEWDCGPRPEARKEEQNKRKVAKVTSEFPGTVGKQDTLWQTAPRGVATGV